MWVTLADLVHELPGRARWHYRSSASPKVLTRSLENLVGVQTVRVNPAAHSLAIGFDPSLTDRPRLETAIQALPRPTVRNLEAKTVPPANLSPLVVSLGMMAGSQVFPEGIMGPATLVTAGPLLAQASKELPSSGITSHVLEAMAVLISLYRKDYLAANTTTFMIELGEYLEDSIAHRSDDLLKQLLKPVGDTVWVIRQSREVLVPVDDLVVGDQVLVGVGQVVPVDGTVLGGEASVNEASMTGESRPVEKARGDQVLSGTVVEAGRLTVYAEQVGAKTAASRIADYVEQSLRSKSQAQVRASQLADRLVPLVLGLAGGAYLVSRDASRAAAVLQADYSCVLKLATPVAFKSAMFGAGRGGILVKGASALERLAEADTVLFDKTGTLTTGTLSVTDALTFDDSLSSDDLIWLAASVEEHYVHPLASAVVEAARKAPGGHFDHTDVEFIVSHGVASQIGSKRIVVGSRHFVEDDEGISFGDRSAEIEALYQQGKTLLFIGLGGRLAGVLGLKDQLRPNSGATVSALRALGVRRILMLTGDHPSRAEELSKELGLDGFHAQLLPHDKAALVESLAQAGAKIAFVGDGVNDAPALAGAHVGIAMLRGADLARISADIALLEDDIGKVAEAKARALSAMGLIRQNYRWAVGLNTAILGAAALGWLSPIRASLFHNGSTIAILLNALRGHRYRRLPGSGRTPRHQGRP